MNIKWEKARFILITALVMMALGTSASAAELRNESSVMHGSRVLITYDLVGDEAEAEVGLRVVVQGKTLESSDLHLTGDYGKVKPGKGRKIYWNVLQDFPRGLRADVEIELFAGGGPVFTSPTIGAEFVLVPAGTFTMGSPADEPGRSSDEDQHRVTISEPFYMQTTEVTQGQWERVMGNNPSYFNNCGPDCPVEQVSWNDVQEFIRKLNSMEGGNKYRLPTEAEWEYTARAGTQTALYSGPITIIGLSNAPALDSIAWYSGNSCVIYSGGYDSSGWKEKQITCPSSGTHGVAQKTPNRWGLYDMIGNVWEWCEDSCEWKDMVVTDTYREGITDPLCRTGTFRVLRGGSWFNLARDCRSANRYGYDPGVRYYSYGFRLLRTQ